MTHRGGPPCSYMSATFKKIFNWIAPFIIAPLIIPVSFFILPAQKVHAVVAPVPIAEIGPNAVVQIENAVQNTIKAAKEYVLDNLVTVIAKTLIRQISQSTINWINSGFKGSPSFIQNPGQFFTGIADQVAGDFIESIGLGFLCEPFRLNLQLSLALEYGGGGSDTDLSCTFSDVLGNIEGFVEGDFTQGGWDGWFKVTQNRNNNPYGAFLKAKSALDIRISGAQGEQRVQLDWGKGFLSLQECDDYDQEGLSIDIGGSNSHLNCKTVTPGAVIEKQLGDVLGTDLRQLELADEINEILGALVGQLTSQLMSATGLAGASGSSGGTSRGRDFTTNTNIGDGYGTGQVADPFLASGITDAENLYADLEDEYAIDTSGFDNLNFGNEVNETGTFNIGLRSESTEQAGTLESYLSEKAVDGNVNGNTSRESVSITASTKNPWWQVDLKNDPSDSNNPTKKWAIGKIEIFPRTSGDKFDNADALGNFRIFITDTPLNCSLKPILNTYPCTTNDGLSLNPLTQPSGLSNGVFATIPLSMPPTGPFNIDLNVPGRFVHIQRIDITQRIHLAEVKIFRNNAPAITLNGPTSQTLQSGEVYTELGAAAFDQSDADLSLTTEGITPVGITITLNSSPVSFVDTNVAGQYIVTYTAIDTGGAVAKKTRRVTVIENTTQSAN